MPPRLALLATPFPRIPNARLPASSGDDFEVLCARLKAEGHAGLDIACASILLIGKQRFARVMREHGFVFVGKVYSSGPGCPGDEAKAAAEQAHPAQGRDVAAHIAVFAAQVREIACSPELRPLLVSISGQSGRDYFDEAASDTFFEAADNLAAELGVQIQHETHRHRLLFCPWSARRAVERRPQLNILADLSHYVCVCETSCDDPDLDEAVRVLLPRVTHTHARVGYEEGPQVPEVAAPQWQRHVEGHVVWWKVVFRNAFARGGDELVTVTPEFLLAPYGKDTSNADSIERANAHIADVVRRAWAEVAAEFA